MSHQILINGHTISSKYGVTSSPTGFWINHEGKIIRQEKGFNPDFLFEMEKRVKSLLALKKAGS